jgi:hypothetical protein
MTAAIPSVGLLDSDENAVVCADEIRSRVPVCCASRINSIRRPVSVFKDPSPVAAASDLQVTLMLDPTGPAACRLRLTAVRRWIGWF